MWLLLAWRDFIMSKPSHDFLVSCALLLVRETPLQIHFDWLNCAGSPRRFSSQNLQDGKCHFLMEWQESPIIISFWNELLGVRNRKEMCYTWILIAATSHIRAWSCWYSRGSTNVIITFFIPCSGYTAWHYQCVPISDQVYFCLWSPSGNVFGILQRSLPCSSTSWMLVFALL
jgi:hypothetical protein